MHREIVLLSKVNLNWLQVSFVGKTTVLFALLFGCSKRLYDPGNLSYPVNQFCYLFLVLSVVEHFYRAIAVCKRNGGIQKN